MIEIRNLTKKYGAHTAVHCLNLTIENGHVYGFLGPNGAGKSTTMNMVAGCLAPSAGTVVINGHDIVDEPIAAKKYIGYLPEVPPLYPDMTPYEYLTFVARAKGIKSSEVHYQVEYVMEETQLKPVENRLIENLSKGYRQRVGIAQAMLGDPEIIILDEPTVGLDPKQKREILDLIRALSGDHTVILSSHILSEIQAVCDDIIIISKGKIVANDTPENLSRQTIDSSIITLILSGELEEIRAFAASLSGAVAVTISENPQNAATRRVEIEVPHTADLRAEIYEKLKKTEFVLYEMTTNAVGLETVYMKLTEGAESADEADAMTLPEPMMPMTGDDSDDIDDSDAEPEDILLSDSEKKEER